MATNISSVLLLDLSQYVLLLATLAPTNAPTVFGKSPCKELFIHTQVHAYSIPRISTPNLNFWYLHSSRRRRVDRRADGCWRLGGVGRICILPPEKCTGRCRERWGRRKSTTQDVNKTVRTEWAHWEQDYRPQKASGSWRERSPDRVQARNGAHASFRHYVIQAGIARFL